MSATDSIRRAIAAALTGDVIEHGAVAVRTDEAEALCNLADFARAEHHPRFCSAGREACSLCDALVCLYGAEYPLREPHDTEGDA